jgi:hypothetical protein
VRNAVSKARLGSGHLAVCCHDSPPKIECNGVQMFLRYRATGSVRIRVQTISVVSAASAAKKVGLKTGQ